MTNIEKYSPRSGRAIKEDGTIINEANIIEQMSNDLAGIKNAGGGLTSVESCEIPNNASVPTAGIDVRNGMITSIKNSGWTPAVMTFLVSDTLDGEYTTLYDDAGLEVTMNVVAGKTQGVTINAIALAAAKFIKPRSGNDAGLIAQTADRTITFSLKR